MVGDQSRHRQRRSRSLRGALVVKGDRGDVRFATADSLAEKLPEIPREKRVAPEETDHAAQREERPEGDRILPANPARGQERCGERAADQDRKQYGEQYQLPAQEGSDHGSELHVPDAHPGLTND